MSVEDLELAWAAGFFDGEGSVMYAERRPARGTLYRQLQTSISQSSSPELLLRFRDAVQAGAVTGPYHANRPSKPIWRWAASCTDTLAIAKKLHLLLGSEKKARFDEAIKRWEGFEPSHVRCAHGGSYATCSDCHRISALKAWETRRAA